MSDLARLKWQCRRGTKELDILLDSYLETCYQFADIEEQQVFVQLLSLEDSELLPLLMGDKEPESKPLAELVRKIRCLKFTV